MRAYIAVKYHEDSGNREHIEAISAVLEEHGFETVCIARDIERWGEVQFDIAKLMQKTFQEIDASNMVVVDLTEKGVGVGIEAGYAAARNIPIITIARGGSPVSETLRGISSAVFSYDQYEDLGLLFAKMKARAE